MLVLDGTRKSRDPIGDYDLYVHLAEAFQWTPDQVDRLDPDFIVELIAKMNARAEHQKLQQERKKKKR
jgi:hypothetical protein